MILMIEINNDYKQKHKDQCVLLLSEWFLKTYQPIIKNHQGMTLISITLVNCTLWTIWICYVVNVSMESGMNISHPEFVTFPSSYWIISFHRLPSSSYNLLIKIIIRIIK